MNLDLGDFVCWIVYLIAVTQSGRLSHCVDHLHINMTDKVCFIYLPPFEIQN